MNLERDGLVLDKGGMIMNDEFYPVNAIIAPNNDNRSIIYGVSSPMNDDKCNSVGRLCIADIFAVPILSNCVLAGIIPVLPNNPVNINLH